MTSEQPRIESYALFSVPGKVGLRVPVRTRTKVTRIIGKHQVRAVEVEDLGTGHRETVSCDTVVFTGDWTTSSSAPVAAGPAVADPAHHRRDPPQRFVGDD